MSELKTLQDLQKLRTQDGDYWYLGSELKAEAVKWVKAHGSEETHYASICNLEGWKHFFNLTEEDLK